MKTDFVSEISTPILGKNNYFYACLNFFVNQCYGHNSNFCYLYSAIATTVLIERLWCVLQNISISLRDWSLILQTFLFCFCSAITYQPPGNNTPVTFIPEGTWASVPWGDSGWRLGRYNWTWAVSYQFHLPQCHWFQDTHYLYGVHHSFFLQVFEQ